MEKKGEEHSKTRRLIAMDCVATVRAKQTSRLLLNAPKVRCSEEVTKGIKEWPLILPEQESTGSKHAWAQMNNVEDVSAAWRAIKIVKDRRNVDEEKRLSVRHGEEEEIFPLYK